LEVRDEIWSEQWQANKNRGPVKTIEQKACVQNSKISKRDHFSDDRFL
jgi:hypothetical protein